MSIKWAFKYLPLHLSNASSALACTVTDVHRYRHCYVTVI